ncbi:MAG TPA: trypsin-like peptidase domain-containing protein [Phycisphaerae bacterium]|nr:trypsin-like peptidase domain-containing protein [Phycisphaerae bacterium]HPS52440.1 trypsin-like peptidase domain-containing protein [Phycisphaerae bacterium]
MIPYDAKKFIAVVTMLAALGGSGVFAQTSQPSTQEALRKEIIEMSRNDRLSNLFTKIYQAVSPSVVVIHTARVSSADILSYYQDRYIREQFNHDYNVGLGSGVIIDAENGYVVTNNHVVANVQRVEVILSDGRILRAQWVRSDPLSDIAVIKIPPQNLTATPLGDSDRLEVGSLVLAFGAPLGLPQTVTAGIVSAKGRKTTGMDYQDFIQTDAAINLGNSGGPLVNMRGEVVGINTLILSSTGMYAGVGLAIPSNMVRNIMKQLVQKGLVMRGYLGAYIQNVSPALARNMNLPHNNGALITNVFTDSPAGKAGLLERDFVISVNNKTIRNANDLRNATASLMPEETATMKILRDGKEIELKVIMGRSRRKTIPPAKTFLNRPAETFEDQVGLFCKTLTPTTAIQYGYAAEMNGAVVAKVLAGSEAFEANIVPGMLVTHVNDNPIKSESELKTAIDRSRGTGIRLTVTTPIGGKWYIFLPLEIF